MVWKKLAKYSLVGGIMEPLISLFALGYGVGSMIEDVDGMSYILFLASGTVVMSAANSTTFEGLYSSYTRMVPQKTWDGLLNAPLDINDIVIGEIIWAASKGWVASFLIMIVIFLFGITREWTMIAAMPFIFITAMTFASFALTFNALSRSYDFFTYYFTLGIVPMSFLSGIYFPLDVLPIWLQNILAYFPLNLAASVVRPLMLGEIPSLQDFLGIAWLILYIFIFYNLACYLTRKRFSKN